MKITKNRYLAGFAVIVSLLALTRCIFPSVADNKDVTASVVDSISADEKVEKAVVDIKKGVALQEDKDSRKSVTVARNTTFFDAQGNPVKNKILSVSSYVKAFPDSNNVQIVSATKYGVSPVENREEAEHRKKELVYVSANPYYCVERMYRSIPYLVPRAAVLLNDIGRAYYDSLQVKGVPLHQFIVTSVLRTKEDVRKLRNYNGNATENSCHLYGTTFDICYNRYKTVSDPEGSPRRQVRNDTLKWVLSEVLNDMRNNGRCYIKYEVKQGCFHITVR